MSVWVGGATAVKQKDTGTVAGTPGAGETLTVTCNSKSAVLTIPAGQTTSQVAAEVVAMVNANSATDPPPATGYTRNVGGREIPEFRDFTAEQNGSVVNFIGAVAGVPFEITLAETMAAGTFTLATGGAGASVACTGPNFVNNAANYQDGALPTGTLAALGAVPMLYGLNYFTANTVAVHLGIDFSLYTGAIGLPDINAGGGYDEYRQKTLDLYSVNLAEKSLRFYATNPGVTSTNPVRITLGTEHSTLDIEAGRGLPVAPNIELYGTSQFDSDVVVIAGSVQFSGVSFLGDLLIGRDAQGVNECRVILSSSCNLSDAEDVWIFNGTHNFRCSTEYLGAGSPTNLRVRGGSLMLDGANGQSLRDVEVFRGGTLLSAGGFKDGTPVAHVFSGGVFDLRQATQNQTWDKVKLYNGATYHDPDDRLSGASVLDFVACSPSDFASSQFPANRRYTLGTIS